MSFFSSRRQSDVTPVLPEEQAQLPKPAAPPQSVGFDTVLGANCTVEGVLRSKANVRLDCTFTGTLEIDGNVLVGETANIKADINAKNVSIAGAVRGNVSGRKVQLLRTGRIWGDIRAMALTTEEGAFIDGKITMIGREEAASAADVVRSESSFPAVEAAQSPALEIPVDDELSDTVEEDASASDSLSAPGTSGDITP